MRRPNDDNDLTGTQTERSLSGALKIRQTTHGYRFSIDSLLLAHHVSLEPGEVGVDLGTGCAVIPLILADRFPSTTIYGIEIQEDMYETALQNVRDNGMANRVRILHGDLKDSETLLKAGVADVVFSNPPYRPVGTGRISPNSQRAIAKHEIKAKLFDVVSAAQHLLRRSGRFWIIYPAGRLVDLLTRMRSVRLEPKRIRLIHSTAESPAELVVVEGVKEGNPGITVLPAVVTHDAEGNFTGEMAKIVRAGTET